MASVRVRSFTRNGKFVKAYVRITSGQLKGLKVKKVTYRPSQMNRGWANRTIVWPGKKTEGRWSWPHKKHGWRKGGMTTFK